MPFSPQSLSVLARNDDFTLWRYECAEDPADLLAAGYFLPAAGILCRGDLVSCVGADAEQRTALLVVDAGPGRIVLERLQSLPPAALGALADVQVGEPKDLYEHPESEFVMGFVGEVNRFGNALIRPHDLDLALIKAEGAEEAMIERVSHLGFEVRVELSMANGDHAWAQVTRAEAEDLELAQGQIIFARPSRARVFESDPATAPTDELQVA